MVFLSLHLRGTKNRQFGQKEQSANRGRQKNIEYMNE